MDDKPLEPAVPRPKRPLTLRGRIVLGVQCVLTVALFLGLWGIRVGGFVPSNLGNTVGLIAAAVGVALGIMIALKQDATRITKLWMKDPFLRSLVCAVASGSMFAVASTGVDWSYTAVFGTVSDRTVTVTSWRSGGYRVCRGPNFAEAPLTSSVCLDASWKASLSPGTRLILMGRQTALGINTERVRLAPQTHGASSTSVAGGRDDTRGVGAPGEAHQPAR